MKIAIALFLAVMFPTAAFAGDYTITLSGDSAAECTVSFSTEAESVDGIHPLQSGDITDFACTITEANPAVILTEADLQYPTGLDYRVTGGKVVELDLQTTNHNQLQIGNAETNTLDDSWQLFGTGTLLNSPSNVVAISESAGGPNNPPVAVDDSTSVSQGIETEIYVTLNDTDADPGDTLTVTQVTQGSDGTVAIGGGGTYATYTSADPFTGNPDTFTYTVSDGTDTDVGTVTVTRSSQLTLAQQAATMVPGEWRQLDTVNNFQTVGHTPQELLDICQNASPACPTGVQELGASSERVLWAWNGAAWDRAGNRMFFTGGGHYDYGGNEVYAFDFDTLAWARLTEAAPLNYIRTSPDREHPTDGNSDGIPDTPPAWHVYDGTDWDPINGNLINISQVGPYGISGVQSENQGDDVSYRFDPDTQTWTHHAGHDYKYARCVYDATAEEFLCIDSVGYSNHPLYRIPSSTQTEIDCSGNFGGDGQSDVVGTMGVDAVDGEGFSLSRWGLYQITFNGCSSSLTLRAFPDRFYEHLFSLYWNESCFVGDGDYLYVWSGDEKIVAVDKADWSSELLFNEDYADTGPTVPRDTTPGGYQRGLHRVYDKCVWFETEGVMAVITDPGEDENPRGGWWLWKPKVDQSDAYKPKLGTLVADGRTQTMLAVALPLDRGDRNYNATVTMRYRETPAGSWVTGMDLKRSIPEAVLIDEDLDPSPDGYYGMIVDLDPDTEYEIETTVSDPDGIDGTGQAAVQSVIMTTRAIPISDYTGFTMVSVDGTYTASQLNSEIAAASAGTVFTIEAGVTITGLVSLNNTNGTESQPIVLRGANQATSVIDGNDNGLAAVQVRRSYFTIENLTLQGDVDGVYVTPVGGGYADGIVIRENLIQDVTDDGIVCGLGSYACRNAYIVDNEIRGPRALFDLTGGGGQRGIEVSGEDIEIAHNAGSGFVDFVSPENNLYGITKAINVHHNLVEWGSDDGFEFDHAHRNMALHHNLSANTASLASFQPVFGGPVWAFNNIGANIAAACWKIKPEYTNPNGFYIYNNTCITSREPWRLFHSGETLYFEALNNLFVGGGFNYQGTPLAGAGDVLRLTNAQSFWGIKDYVDYNGWAVNGPVENGQFTFGNSFGSTFAAWKALPIPSGTNDVWVSKSAIFGSITLTNDVDDFADAEWVPTGKVYTLHAGSAARDAGVVIPGVTPAGDGNPDIGACDSDALTGCDSTGTFYGVR